MRRILSISAISLVAVTFATTSFAGTERRTLAQTESERGVKAVSFDPQQEIDWQVVAEDLYNVPRGYSFTPAYSFGNTPAAVDAVKLELFVTRGERCGAGVYALDVQHSPTQTLGTRYFPNAAGIVELPNATVYQVLVTLWQPQFPIGQCTLRISMKGQSGGSTTPPADPAGYVFAGVARYEGGFRHRVGIDLTGERIVRFWARVPSHCEGLETLEGGTVTEGIYDAARLVDATRNIFKVNGTDGVRAGAINLSFNGPQGLVCDIPVYVQNLAR